MNTENKPAVAMSEGQNSGPDYLVTAWGETDLPEAMIVHSLDDAKQAVLTLMWDSPSDAPDDERDGIFESINQTDEWPWKMNFEIGGVEIAKVFTRALASQQRAVPQAASYAHRIAHLEGEEEISEAVIGMMSRLLASIAITLKGEQAALKRHSYHDLAELVKVMALELDLYKTIYGDKVPEGWESGAAGQQTNSSSNSSSNCAAVPQAAPEGCALVPLKMTRAMREVTDEEGWQWEDLLAAAEAITEEQYNEIASAPADVPQAASQIDQIDRIDLINGCGWLKREARTTGANGWLLYNKRDQLLCALPVYEVTLVDSAIAAAVPQAVAVPEWQPIETAPKDGRTILLGRFNSLGKWRTMRGQWFTQAVIDDEWEDPDGFEAGWFETAVEPDAPNCWPIAPSHWMPLPAIPTTPSGEAAGEENV